MEVLTNGLKLVDMGSPVKFMGEIEFVKKKGDCWRTGTVR